MRTAKGWAEEICMNGDYDLSMITQYIVRIQNDVIDWTLLAATAAVIDLPNGLFHDEDTKCDIVKTIAKVKP